MRASVITRWYPRTVRFNWLIAAAPGHLQFHLTYKTEVLLPRACLKCRRCLSPRSGPADVLAPPEHAPGSKPSYSPTGRCSFSHNPLRDLLHEYQHKLRSQLSAYMRCWTDFYTEMENVQFRDSLNTMDSLHEDTKSRNYKEKKTWGIVSLWPCPAAFARGCGSFSD